MPLVEPSASQKPLEPSPAERLDSWKEIAAYLKRDESTVRRWEEEGLPVHRQAHKKKATVFAYSSEIDRWLNNGHASLQMTAAPERATERRTAVWWTAGALVLLVLTALGLNVLGVRNRLLARSVAGQVTSIAVLPLKNLSGDPRQDYFADGMTEALITRLGQISALQVISHQSVLRYRGTTKSLPQIAQELNVGALLEGTVLHSGNRVRITANFVQALPERHLWAQSYEFDPRDVLAVQGEVARDVASRIQINITPQENARLTGFRPVDPEAYEAYLLGRVHTYQAAPRRIWSKAKEYFEKAIEKDPSYAPAYASLAELYVRTGLGTVSRDPRGIYWDGRRQARQLAEKALELDDRLAEAHTALARVAEVEWEWAKAQREYRRAIELNPSYPMARIWYAMHLYGMERFEEASAEAKRAQQLDPVSSYVNTWAGAAHFFAGRVDEAMVSLRRALELDPSNWEASLVLARNYVTQGMYQQAIAELEKARISNAREPEVLAALAHAYARAGERAEAMKIVSELKQGTAEGGNVPPFQIAWAYAGLGDNDQAFAWLERAYEERRIRMQWLNVDPLLARLRSDPRFTDLVRRMGLPQR
jgi:TolB-like protein/Tfp pilus assembly protein PilF